MHIHACIQVHTCICVCMHVWPTVCVCATWLEHYHMYYICTYTHVYMYVCMYVCMTYRPLPLRKGRLCFAASLWQQCAHGICMRSRSNGRLAHQWARVAAAAFLCTFRDMRQTLMRKCRSELLISSALVCVCVCVCVCACVCVCVCVCEFCCVREGWCTYRWLLWYVTTMYENA